MATIGMVQIVCGARPSLGCPGLGVCRQLRGMYIATDGIGHLASWPGLTMAKRPVKNAGGVLERAAYQRRDQQQ